MGNNNRLGIALLVLGAVVAAWNVPAAVAQRITAGGATPSNKKDNDKDDDEKDRNKGDRKDRSDKSANQGSDQTSGQGSQSNKQNKSGNDGSAQSNSQGQGASNQGGNSANTGNLNKSGNPSASQQLQQLMQQRRSKRDNDDDKNANRGPNFGPDDPSKIFGPGQPGFGNKLPNQPIKLPNPPAASPANNKLGHWQGDKWQGTQKADTWVQVFGGHTKPFSAQWYKDHPQAWRYDNNRWNVWVGATVPGVYSWLNWGPAPREYSVGFGPADRFDPNRYGQWYPLGVFSLQSGPEDVGTRVVQLAVDRRGNVTGNYFDMITNVNHNITGGVDRDAQRVMWWLDRNPSIQYHARIYRLLQPYGSIYVELPGGDQRWHFVRLEN